MAISHTLYIMSITILILGVTTMSNNTELGQHHTLPVVKRPRCLGIVNFMVYCAVSISSYYPARGYHRTSERCCRYALKADILHFCDKYMNKEFHSPSCVVQVARYCGNPLPKGSKCGSKSCFINLKFTFQTKANLISLPLRISFNIKFL
ncbi:hypothetical protein PHJA_001726000 [Phtheirospermum japonicum]|uniref:Bifunctional inhibitor/plant lipid transfer protein/seed storage helical domain-containing protein n=1 Tax=Phtheirospermum japonicum TaxID=374723 RepID=A0A830CFJ1_9LAMI|nr:hypothetical protein PHJA_001726000 [Phtheirospermum japonicum]